MSTVGNWRGPNIVKDGLVLYLDAGSPNSYINGISGTSWKDISGNSNNGTLTNGPIFNSENGGSIVFDGVDDVTDFGDILDMGTNSITINIWIKLPTTPNPDAYILSKSRAAAQNYRYGFFLTNSRKLGFFIQGNGGLDIFPNGNSNLTSNLWYMATVVVDRGSTIKIYLNSILETLTGNATISQWNGLDFQSNNPFRVGSYTTSNNTGLTALFKGNIALTQMYNRALSDTEILQNYNASKTLFGL
jgi:hypothetical protein